MVVNASYLATWTLLGLGTILAEGLMQMTAFLKFLGLGPGMNGFGTRMYTLLNYSFIRPSIARYFNYKSKGGTYQYGWALGSW